MNKLITDVRFIFDPQTQRNIMQTKSVPVKPTTVNGHDTNGRFTQINYPEIVGPESTWETAETVVTPVSEPNPDNTKAETKSKVKRKVSKKKAKKKTTKKSAKKSAESSVD